MITYKNYLLGPTHKLPNRRKSMRSGAAIVEMVAAVPLFCIMLFYIVQYGYTLNAFVTLSDIARETARYAAVHGTESGACGSVTSYGNTVAQSMGMGSSVVTITGYTYDSAHSTWNAISPCDSSTNSNWGTAGKVPARVQVSYDFSRRNLHFPFVYLPNNLNSSQPAYATMYVEPQQ
jgi:Flp pilus assembly protein TadG